MIKNLTKKRALQKRAVVLLFFFFSISAFSQISFYREIATPIDEEFFSITEIDSGNYIAVGRVQNPPYAYGNSLGYIAKFDAFGNLLLEKIDSNFLTFNYFSDIDSSKTIIGVKDSNTFFIQKINNQLDTIWNRNYLFKNFYYSSNPSFRKFDNGTYASFTHGYSKTLGNGQDVYLFKFTPSGDSLQYKIYPFPNMQLGFDVIKLKNNRYKMFTRGVPGSNLPGIEINTLDTHFNILNTKKVTNLPLYNVGSLSYIDMISNVKNLTDSTYLMYGRWVNYEYFFQTDHRYDHMGLFFVNEKDSVTKSIEIGKSDTSEAEPYTGMDFIYQDHIYCAGTSDFNYNLGFPSFSNDITWFFITKFDHSGNQIWEKWFGGDANYYVTCLKATKDSGCIITGTKYDYIAKNGVQERDLFILKVGPDGILTSSNNSMEPTALNHKIFPNPNNGAFTLRGSFPVPAVLELYNATGGLVHSAHIQSTNQNIRLPLNAGMYFYLLRSKNNFLESGKLLVE